MNTTKHGGKNETEPFVPVQSMTYNKKHKQKSQGEQGKEIMAEEPLRRKKCKQQPLEP